MGEEPKVVGRLQVSMEDSRQHFDNVQVSMEDSMQHCDDILDLYAAVEELHSHSSQELKRLLEDSQNLTLCLITQKGSLIKVDMEKVAWQLPLHLLAVLVSSNGAQLHLEYLLCGVRLLHTLSDLASQHVKLEQILLDELRFTEQVIDLVFFMLVVLAHSEQDSCIGTFLMLYHATLVACTLYLLTAFVSPEWPDVVHVLIAHPKVDVFMDAAFDSVRKDIGFLELELQALSTKQQGKIPSVTTVETTAISSVQQCEASIEALHSLCLQKSFRERLLQNKELCENGGVLSLAASVLKLKVQNFRDAMYIDASVSRLKSKMLSMLLQLCESEGFSYLDKVAASPRSMHLAVSVIAEVLDLLKFTLHNESKPLERYSDHDNPKGYILLNSMRLVDNLSNDTNFRSLIIKDFTRDLVQVLALPPEEFVSSWCAIDLSISEEDATLVYDPFHAAGAVMTSLRSSEPCALSASADLDSSSDEANDACALKRNCISPATHAQQRTASLVNILANLHCNAPSICKEVKNEFLDRFLDLLAISQFNPSSDYICGSETQTTLQICKNLCALLDHVMLRNPKLQEEDVQVLSDFLKHLHNKVSPEPLAAEELHCLRRSSIYPIFSGNDQIHAGISGMQMSGLYRVANRCKQETTSTEENMTSCIKSLANEKEEIEYLEKISANVDAQEANSFKGFNDKLSCTTKGIRNTERNWKASMASNTGINVENVIAEVVHDDNVPKADFMATQDETYDDKISSDTNYDNQISADGEKEDIVGVVVQGSEEVDVNTGHDRQPRKRARYIDSDEAMDSEDIETNAEDRKPRKRTWRFKNGKQIGGDANRLEGRRARKKPWRIMNDRQKEIMEVALRTDPDMQKNRDALQLWTEELKKYGPEFKIRQLKKWIYNRKDKLARESRVTHGGREARTSDGESTLL